MNMIDQYLEAVAAQLPEAERADIVAELREMILSSFEAKESQLHRALNDEERLEILRAIGHPLVVAARYRKGPEALIGPELFPYWLFAVKAGLLVQAALFALSLVLGLLSDPQHVTRDLMQIVHDYIWAALALIGLTTLVGAVLEHNKIKPRWMTQWRIKDLQVFSLPSNWILPAETWKPRTASRAVRRKLPGAGHIVPFLACIIFLLWWTGLVPFEAWTHMRRRDEDILVTAAPIWTSLHGIILIFVLAQMASHLFGLLRSHAIRLQAMLEIALACAGLWILWTVYQAGHLATLTRSQGAETARVEVTELTLDREVWRALEGRDDWFPKLATTLSMTISWVMAIIVVVTLVTIAKALWKIGRA